MGADFTSGGRDRGTCSVCGGNFEITRKGVIRHHGGWIRCSGAGKPPKTP